MKHQVLYSAAAIQAQVAQLAERIDRADVDSYLVLTVLKGAAIFSSDLVRAMETETQLEYITASSYTDGFTPGATLTVSDMPELNMRDRHVLIVEDIIDSGRTLQAIAASVSKQDPRSISTVALINKTNRRTTDFEATYTGLNITDELIYGYGLDRNQRYRDLAYIAIATPENANA